MKTQAEHRILLAWVGVVLSTLFSVTGCGMDGFAGSEEFTDLSGPAARRRLDYVGPDSVDAARVASVDYKTEWSRDSSSTWYRITLDEPDAVAWMDDVHADEEAWARKLAGTSGYAPEGVRRAVAGPPPLHRQTGTTPAWWSPPSKEFRATEVMAWYVSNDSGVGRATYSAFDDSTNMLWIYRYTAQHDLLWPRSHVPEGERLRLSEGPGNSPSRTRTGGREPSRQSPLRTLR